MGLDGSTPSLLRQTELFTDAHPARAARQSARENMSKELETGPRPPIETPTRREEFAGLTRLATPVVIAELGWMGMGVVDTAMVGQVSPIAMGAVAVGSNIFFLFMGGGLGFLFGLDTVVSQAIGAGRIGEAHRSLIQGLILAFGSSLFLTGCMFASAWNLDLVGIPDEVLPDARSYLWITALSMPALSVFTALRRYLQAMNLVRAFMVVVLAANVLNALVNWVLVFGNWGAPAMEADGSAWATVISRAFMMLALGTYTLVHARRKNTGLLQTPLRLDKPLLARITRIGLPAGGQFLLETGFFNIAALLAARLGPLPLAAHQVAITVAAFSFMTPLGISSAAAVRVGQAVGRGDAAGARLAGRTALVSGGVLMIGFAMAFFTLGREIAELFTTDPEVISIAARIFAVAGAFQLFDGVQVIAVGALRGLGETRIPVIIGALAYWVVGISLATTLAFHLELGVLGLWYGFVVALAVAAAALLVVWNRQAKDPLQHRFGGSTGAALDPGHSGG